MTYFAVDVEADGPIPHKYSMIEIGIVVIDSEGKLDRTFYGKLKPISEHFDLEALNVTGHTREQTLAFDDPREVMLAADDFVVRNTHNRAKFLSDNNGFDFGFYNYYSHYFLGRNTFGYSSRNLADIFHGMTKDMRARFKHLRKTAHTHNPVDDAKGNAEAFLEMKKLGLFIDF